MGQVRWAGWTMAIATALVISGGQVVRADVASDKPAAIVVYPKVQVNLANGIDTAVRLTNTNRTSPVIAHCFYLDANSHCSGGGPGVEGIICTDDPTVCGGVGGGAGGLCIPGWNETDFHAVLTPSQPITWKAGDGLSEAHCAGGPNNDAACVSDAQCAPARCVGVPIPTGFCQRNQFRQCVTDAECNPFPGGSCTQSNAETRIPPVPENPFVGELKCIQINEDGTPQARNDLKGEAVLETVTALGNPATQDIDVAGYNAIGIQATGNSTGAVNELTLGGTNAEYNGCPNFLILDHFFDQARDPVPGSSNFITTNLVLVPCSEDLLRQIPGVAVVQYLVFNEFEQKFSTSNTVRCFQDIQLCRIGGGQCARSIFNVGVAGTLTGQTRMQPLGIPPLPSGLIGIAIERHTDLAQPARFSRTGAFNLQMSGVRQDSAGNALTDTITIP